MYNLTQQNMFKPVCVFFTSHTVQAQTPYSRCLGSLDRHNFTNTIDVRSLDAHKNTILSFQSKRIATQRCFFIFTLTEIKKPAITFPASLGTNSQESEVVCLACQLPSRTSQDPKCINDARRTQHTVLTSAPCHHTPVTFAVGRTTNTKQVP